MGGSAKELYEKGVSISMDERGVAVGSYLTTAGAPADYTSSIGSGHNAVAVSSVSNVYNEMIRTTT